jgi:heat shock protein HtpX
MSMNLHQFKSADWRQIIKQNTRKTYLVIFLFLIMFLVLGFLIDFIWRYNTVGVYAQNAYGQYQTIAASPGQIFQALMTFKLVPYATIISVVVAFIWVLCTFAFYNKIMLSGTQYKEILPNSSDSLSQRIYNVVEEMKLAANMSYMPKVYLIEANYMNAFASGYSEKSAMIAITRTLAEALSRDELQAVMAHELTHIRHQDIKLNLFTIVLANMLMFMVDILFYSVLFGGSGQNRRDSRNNNGNNIMMIIFIAVMVLRFVLPLITSMMMLFLSRTREYMADAGAVELMRDNGPMARALMKISGSHQDPAVAQAYKQTSNERLRRASYIFDPNSAQLAGERKDSSDFFSTHPSLKKRLAAMGFKQK